jgi:PAS domain S-box-containing protein
MEVKEKTKRQVIRELEKMDQQATKLKDGESHNKSDEELRKKNASRILVVDDASVDRELLKNILTNHGYQVSMASSGSMALRSVPVEMPDLILLDVKMPGMDGYDVCRMLKSDEQSPQIPIIFISSLDETEDIVKGFNAGGVDFISKPFQPAEVMARVETHLALRCLQRKLEAQNIQLQQEINDRKQAERLLLEREAHYRAIVETFDGFIYICSKDYRVEFMNERFIKRTGYDGTGEICYKVIHDRDSICPWCVNDRVFSGETVRWEVQSPKDNRWLYVVNTPLYHEDGTISKQSMILDITDRKQVEEELQRSHDNLERLVAERTDELLIKNRQLEAEIEERKKVEEYLRESEQRLSDIIDFLPDATFAIDSKGKVIAWNRAIEEMTGAKPEDILGKGDYEYALPFYGFRRPILIDSVFSTDEKVQKEYSFFKKEGDVLWAEGNASVNNEIRVLWAKASPLYDCRGNILGAIESIRDITERRRAEESLKKREKELDVKTRNLEELNTALKVLLKQREDDKNEIEKRTMSNVKELIIPYIEKLKKGSLDSKDMAYLRIVESNLNGILSPFSHRLSTKYMSFTPKELQIAHLIAEGKTTKEIAELLNTSTGTIDFHRNNIRNKLNLKNRRANLRSYLLTLS